MYSFYRGIIQLQQAIEISNVSKMGSTYYTDQFSTFYSDGFCHHFDIKNSFLFTFLFDKVTCSVMMFNALQINFFMKLSLEVNVKVKNIKL